MRWFALLFCAVLLTGCGTFQTWSGTGIVKVLPHYLDEEGQSTDGPTLLHRDVYQDQLRKNPDLVHGVRYDVNWHGTGELTVRLEIRSTKAGVAPKIIEETAAGSGAGTHWTKILIDADTYKTFGQPESWRVTLWQGDEQVAEQKSFLW